MDNETRKETFSKILYRILRKFHDAVIERQTNELHPIHDLVGANQLTISEYNNLQKLQYWGLLLRSGKTDKDKSGKWFMADVTPEFLANRRAIHKHIYVRGGHKVAEEPEMVRASDVAGDEYAPVVLQRDDYARQKSGVQMGLGLDVPTYRIRI